MFFIVFNLASVTRFKTEPNSEEKNWEIKKTWKLGIGEGDALLRSLVGILQEVRTLKEKFDLQ